MERLPVVLVCAKYRQIIVQASMELGPEDVSLVSSFQRVLCTGFKPEDVSLLERCPHFRGCYVQASNLKMCPY